MSALDRREFLAASLPGGALGSCWSSGGPGPSRVPGLVDPSANILGGNLRRIAAPILARKGIEVTP